VRKIKYLENSGNLLTDSDTREMMDRKIGELRKAVKAMNGLI